MIKVAFNSQISNVRNPALVLQRMNLGLSGQLNNEFITAGYLGIDLKLKKLTYSSAGHPPLILYRRSKDEIKEISVPGIPMGIFPETSFNDTKIQLKSGDRLVLYTDGIMDVVNPGGELFGKHRFMDLIQQTKNFLSDDAVDAMIEQLHAWSGKKEDEAHEDDITLIIFDMM